MFHVTCWFHYSTYDHEASKPKNISWTEFQEKFFIISFPLLGFIKGATLSNALSTDFASLQRVFFSFLEEFIHREFSFMFFET